MVAVQCEFSEMFLLAALNFYFGFFSMVKSLHCKYVLQEVIPSHFM